MDLSGIGGFRPFTVIESSTHVPTANRTMVVASTSMSIQY
jgi:hypothetical protein